MSYADIINHINNSPNLVLIKTIIYSKCFNVVLSLIILLIAINVVKFIITKILHAIIKTNDDDIFKRQVSTLFNFIQTLCVFVILGLYITTLMSKFGIDIAPILTAAGVLGVAVGFGAKRLVEDIISGVLLLLEGQIRIGDYIKIGEYEGFVEKFDLKMVVIRSLSGEVNYIRNGMIDVVTNCSRQFNYCIQDIGVGYGENINRVIEVLQTTFDNEFSQNPKFSESLLGKLEVLGLEKFDDSAIVLKYQFKTKPMQAKILGREFNILIKNKFDEIGIEIPFPQRVVHLVNEDNK